MKRLALYTILFVFASLFSCSTTIRYVPVETVRLDSVYITRYHVDTTYVKDSIHIYNNGDTVTITKDRYVYKYRNKVDTLYITRNDSIRIPYPVEKKLPRWQQVKVDYGGWSMMIIFVFILIVVGKLVYKLKK